MAMDLKWLLSADDKATPVFEKLKGVATDAGKGVEGAFSGAMGKFNLLTGAVTGMMAIAAGGAFSKVIKETVAWTGEAVALSKSLGITTQQASILNLALGDVYLTKETMLAGSNRIAKTLKTEEEAFTKLGVATRDQSGHYRSTLDIMTDVNTKLGTLKEGTDRNIAGMAIYGKSWGELSGLLKLNAAAMQDAEEKAKRLGLEVGDEAVKNAKKYKAALNDIEDVGKSLAVRFGTVLLPMLVKIGAFLGNNGPLLADAFRWTLNALGNTINTLGEWLGLLAFRAYSTFGIIKNVLSGNFGEAKNQFSAMVAAGEDFNKRTKANWAADWSKDKDITSKAIKGDLVTPDDSAEKAKAAAEAEKQKQAAIKLWSDKSKAIIDIEKTRISELLTMEKDYLAKLKTEYETHVKTLETFSEAFTKVKDSIAARNKKDADANAAALRGPEDGYQKYYREQEEARIRISQIDTSPGWTAASEQKKLEMWNTELDLAQKLRDEAKTANIESISQYQIEADYQAKRADLEQKILDLGVKQTTQLTDNAVKSAESITLQQKQVDLLQKQVSTLENMIRNIPDVSQKTINLTVNGIQDLYKVQELMNVKSSTGYGSGSGSDTDYSEENLRTQVGGAVYDSWLGPLATGTNYVPKDGPAYLHKGEAVVPAQYNPAAGGTGSGVSMSFGDVSINLPNVTNQTTAKELARMVMPELKALQSQRFRTA